MYNIILFFILLLIINTVIYKFPNYEEFQTCNCKLIYSCFVNRHLQRRCTWLHSYK